MCDEQAAKRFHENEQWDQRFLGNMQSTVDRGYTSHYDPKVNVCYVRLHSIGETSIAETVFDAFEGREYASFAGSEPKNGVAKPPLCEIRIPGKPAQDCHSADEFNSLVEKYFGVPE
jgi:hypothetical protein